MPKLWIVHRQPDRRTALARLAGLPTSDVMTGAPQESDFAAASHPHPHPAVIVLGVEGDFERELDFAHRISSRLPSARWILLTTPEDAPEAGRLFALVAPEILEALPSARSLRAHLAQSFARRTTESLAERRTRQQMAARFSAWLGSSEVPGLLRALDPALGGLPLLVRGVPGSGRALLARYVELFRSSPIDPPGERRRNGSPRVRRIHAGEVSDTAALARRIAAQDVGPAAANVIWIDEVESLSATAQHALADWIRHGSTPGPARDEGPHWVATAAPASWQDRLEPALERAFAPLIIEIPALGDSPSSLEAFAEQIALDWSRSVGGPPRRLAASALAELADRSWPGDRAELEAVLRATFVSTASDPIEAAALSTSSAATSSTAPSSEPPSSEIPTRLEDATPFDAVPVVEAIEEDRDGDEALAVFEAESPSESTSIDWAQTSETPAAIGGERPDLAPPGLDLDVARDPIEDGNFDVDLELDESSRLADASFGVGASGSGVAAQAWRRLARSLSHEIRNPLVSIRTFAELLPEHYQDETFRQRFADLVGRDVAHIADVVSRMQSVAEADEVAAEAIDVSDMLEELLEQRRQRIEQQRLLVLRELERDAPLAWCEAGALRVALAGLLDRALDSLAERGDLFVATRRVERGDGSAWLRILLRHHSAELAGQAATDLEELNPAANVLEYVLAETVARANGGSLTIDSSDARETLILMDLRTPG